MADPIPFPVPPDGGPPPRHPRGPAVLAGLLVIVQGAVQLARIAVVAALLLLAAIGLLTLLGR